MTSSDDVQIVVVDSGELRRGWRAKLTRPVVGVALCAIGVVAIIVGYLGVAHETLVAKQIPYLVSGGIGGMVLVAVGAFLLGTDDVRHQLERVEKLEAMVGDLHRALLERPERPGTGATAPEPEHAGANGYATPPPVPVPETDVTVVALARGKSYHLPSCTMVAGKHPEAVDAGTIATRGLSPCPLCDPAGAMVAH